MDCFRRTGLAGRMGLYEGRRTICQCIGGPGNVRQKEQTYWCKNTIIRQAVRLVPYAAVGYEREITPALSGYVRGEVTYARAFTTTMAGKDFVQPVIKVG